MKKNIIYIAILVFGLVLGYVFFGTSSEGSSNTKNVSNMSESVETENQMWTCSMHPQIMQPEPGDCPICGMDLIPAETGADGLAMNGLKMSENAMALANIQTTIVGNRMADNESMISLSGKIVVNGDETATQPAHFNGRIEKLFVTSLGEKVQMGQAVAEVYSPDLVAAQQELITAYRIRESQPQLYQAVRNKFKNWKIHGTQIDEIERSGEVKTRFTIYSHVSGVVSSIEVNEGAHIMNGHPIFKVSNLNTVWAEFDAYENQISQLKEGQRIKVTTNAYSNKEFEATVSFIDPTLNTKSRTVSVRTTLNNKKDLLKPGMFVSAKVQMSADNATETQITVPATAVLWTGNRSLVYVKTNPNEPVFEMREVTLGTKNGDIYNIVDGLKNGEKVVTNGTFTVDAAAQLQGKKSMMNTKGGKSMTGHEGHSGMGNSDNTETTNHITQIKRMEVSSKFQAQLKSVFDDYINIESALVKDNSETAKMGATSLLNTISKVDMKLLKYSNAHTHWMQLEKELKSSATSISQTSDIKKQREHFIHLSAHLINAVKTFGINQKVYVDFCPMANNNVGAYWLSNEKEIRNPYFEKEMLDCGSVEDEID